MVGVPLNNEIFEVGGSSGVIQIDANPDADLEHGQTASISRA
ncbi:hypothetical protein [Rubinisphaera italica]|nr:hypothetical protein [Rubinisphaera italica]